MQYWILTLKSIILLPILNMFGAVKNILAQQELDLSQFGATVFSVGELDKKISSHNNTCNGVMCQHVTWGI